MKIDLRLTFHYGLTIFLSAFLLFQVQPLIGKMILPWFGGSASVWTTCMLFFQMVLLLGYFYSHWVVRFLTPYRQSLLHGSLLLVCILLMPIAASADWKPTGAENPTLRILGLLTVSIGLPYFVLSTTGPLLQAWFARERSGLVPYRLFALSNFGSMLALLAYPVAVEPVFPTRWQSYLWSGLFVCFVVSCALLAWRGRNGKPIVLQHHQEGPAPRWTDKVLWAALAACPSILMVADTSYLTANIAPIPMIWVAPLALYLLSFIMSFERRGWYQRKIFLPLLVVGLGALAYLPTLGMSALPVFLAMAINLSAFFVACMVCHGELARLQPHPSHLTGYYLMLAVGGAAGGFFVGVIAPYWFNSNYELSIGIVLTGIVAAIAVIPSANFSRPAWRRVSIASTIVLLLALSWIRIVDHHDETSGAEVTQRNFYGTLQVFVDTKDDYRSMLHGQIVHGRQHISAQKLDLPTTYYSADGGAGKAMQIKAAGGPLRVGVIGLGVGTLVSYGRKNDYFRLYEIDPLVIDIAHKNFSYLARTAATTEIILGDARLQLENEPAQQFDVLVVDAFSGDSVPVHLLTREAFAQYFRHLKPDGVLAVHITNRFLDLQPVVKTAADHFGKDVRLVDFEGDRDRLVFRSRWALISGDPSFFKQPQLSRATSISVRSDFKPWKDDYSSIFSILM
ncbi:spermidine synthase [Propionivibrio sp.]|uniref:spermidine synthase n=1 Tax=Propionivibrio sp. TaxID=2212460 RepID=UPI003BF30AAF